jgi:PAS domain S-box-containing protein
MSSPKVAPLLRGRCDLARVALENIPAMVAYWDADQRCRYANRAYERWFGVRPEELLGRHIAELLGPLHGLNRPFIEAALRGEPQEFERLIPDPAGGPPRYGLASYIPDVVEGTVCGFFVLVTDISATKRVEQALRESEERFRLTLEEAPIGMAVVGTDGSFVRVNRALCEILGYSAPELVGLTFQSVTHPDDLGADLALAGQLARGRFPATRSRSATSARTVASWKSSSAAPSFAHRVGSRCTSLRKSRTSASASAVSAASSSFPNSARC